MVGSKSMLKNRVAGILIQFETSPYPSIEHLIFHHGCSTMMFRRKPPNNRKIQGRYHMPFLSCRRSHNKKGEKKTTSILLLRKNSPPEPNRWVTFCSWKRKGCLKRDHPGALSKSMGKWCNHLSASP